LSCLEFLLLVMPGRPSPTGIGDDPGIQQNRWIFDQ
jgi:hypothetical protein